MKSSSRMVSTVASSHNQPQFRSSNWPHHGESGKPAQSDIAGRRAGCSTAVGINVFSNWWVFKDLKITDYGRTIYLQPGVNNVTIEQNIISRFRSDGVFVHNGNNNIVQNNVIGYGIPCISSHDMAGIYFVTNSDKNKAINNSFLSVSNDYSLFPALGVTTISSLRMTQTTILCREISSWTGRRCPSSCRQRLYLGRPQYNTRDNAFLWTSGATQAIRLPDASDQQDSFTTPGTPDFKPKSHHQQDDLFHLYRFNYYDVNDF